MEVSVDESILLSLKMINDETSHLTTDVPESGNVLFSLKIE